MAGRNQNNVGSGWIRTSKSTGTTFMSLSVELDGKQHNLLVFKNTKKKEGTKAPDYNVIEGSAPTKAPAKEPEKKAEPESKSSGAPW